MARIDLSGDQWVEVRRVSGEDVMFLEEERHRRGFDSEPINIVLTCGRVVTAWSREGEVTPEGIRALPEDDLVRIYAAAKGVDYPNLFSPSPAGTPQTKATKKTTAGSRRTSGE